MVLKVSDIDWSTWQAHNVATLIFMIRGQEVLLIRKLRGLGKGKINAPGGRQEPGETLEEAAIREAQEEVGMTPIEPRFRGVLRFHFVNRPADLGASPESYHLECHVFSTDRFEGEPRPSDEAIPMWVPLAELPYDEMWADDVLWCPLMLSGRTPFEGRFIFEDNAMKDVVLVDKDPAQPLFRALEDLSIPYLTHQHAPVFTVAQAQKVRQDEVGLHTKNLFLRNKKGQLWLVTLREDRPVDLKALAIKLNAGHLSFASSERLREYLKVEPGSVTPLAAFHDQTQQVKVVLDSDLAESEAVWVHPLTNDRTTCLHGGDLVRFLRAIKHPPELVHFA